NGSLCAQRVEGLARSHARTDCGCPRAGRIRFHDHGGRPVCVSRCRFMSGGDHWEKYNIFFLETPLPADDLAGYARLSREQSIPIAAGEWLATRFEFLALMDQGRIR